MRNVVQLCLALSAWLQIIFWSCVNETKLFSFLRSLSVCENGRFPKIFITKETRGLNDKKIIELGYRKVS